MSTRELILGTAGHIDHGKSALVKALTGVDPDRLEEEKRRGITIELGFAQLVLPSGISLGIVDVPGHERFVRQMMAGASGVDITLLVIAADDGIMPQTVEHLRVLELLAIPRLVVAITKIDKVDIEWLNMITAEVRTFVEQSSYPTAPIIALSSITGVGLPELVQTLDEVAQSLPARADSGLARLPIDRSFSIKGAGTVVTGTLWNGSIRTGDQLELVPSGELLRVRGLQLHNQPAYIAHAGSRVALNLNNVTPAEVSPGHFLATPGSLKATDRLDVSLSYLGFPGRDRPLNSGARVRIAHGTCEVLGRVLFMDGLERLQPGEKALAQLRLDEALAPLATDRFVLRSYSPIAVIGGGVVLLTHPHRRTQLKTSERALLEALEQRDDKSALDAAMQLATEPQSAASLSAATGIAPDTVAGLLPKLDLYTLGSEDDAQALFWLTAEHRQVLLSELEQQLLDFHKSHPDALGITVAALKHDFAPRMPDAAFSALLMEATKAGFAQIDAGLISHSQAGSTGRQAETTAMAAIMALLAEQPATPPAIEDLPKLLDLDKSLTHRALGQLEKSGQVVRIGGNFDFTASAYEQLRTNVTAYLKAHGQANAAELKDAMHTSRKYAIPLLEHFDLIHLTRRDGDQRSLA